MDAANDLCLRFASGAGFTTDNKVGFSQNAHFGCRASLIVGLQHGGKMPKPVMWFEILAYFEVLLATIAGALAYPETSRQAGEGFAFVIIAS